MTALGEFLQARRAATSPSDVGLPPGVRRRVPGLRREEIAMLAGMSVDYYVRLEQGRETGPSAQLLDALASALRLDEDGRQHLFRLGGLAPREDGSGGPTASTRSCGACSTRGLTTRLSWPAAPAT